MLGQVPAILPRFDFRVEHAVASDIGSRRKHYEDAYLVAPELAVFAVADGMGGHQAGEVAAQMAVAEVRRSLSGRQAQRVMETYVTKADLPSRREVFACLRRAFELANERVREDADKNPEHEGMGTTLDVVWLARDTAFIGHAGDGRVYLARSRAMLQLTQDHNSLASARLSAASVQSYRSGVTNAIGLSDGIGVDTLFVDLTRGDRLLICSDGIHGQVGSEAELSDLVRTGSATDGAQSLVARAAEQGRDNATAVVLDIGERFVRRNDRDRGLGASDLERARQSPLLVDLPESFALSALSAAVEVEIAQGETIPRVLANDLVAYIVLDGLIRYPTLGRTVGAGALIFPESLLGVAGQGEQPVAEQTSRMLRVRADDFSEICGDPRLAAELYRRLATHIARLAQRPDRKSAP
jgi:PPM family protein phosphatase